MHHGSQVVHNFLYLITEKLQVPKIEFSTTSRYSSLHWVNHRQLQQFFSMAVLSMDYLNWQQVFEILYLNECISPQPFLWIHYQNRFKCTFVHFALFDLKNHQKIQQNLGNF